ncbi:hypothetical protein [Enhygromyxa salina]|uniref:Uncharacterized protein n=1 Tax=Enhygromyxa salina TaxID=215803 RepID=A0A2S9YP98_9BACT|nr:hypothetical protein [Enhygromyxa salina]PRQ06889.1 hypothetical protein ENSA7_34270 [Enhygromyxa salina]
MADTPASSSGSFSDGSIVDDVHQIKGLALASVQTHVIETFGQAEWDALMKLLPPRTSGMFEDVDTGDWYPETEMRRVVHALYQHLAQDDDERFMALMRGVATVGINRFFGMILTITTGRFVLRNIPAFWRRVRRGPAVLHTETDAAGRVLVHYSDFRYCRDRIYRLVSLANCEAAAYAATKRLPKGEVAKWDRYSMTLAFTLTDD